MAESSVRVHTLDNIYLDSGYVDIEGILYTLYEMGIFFVFIIGGRGTGKTYGALKTVLENNIKFILMRRTQTQCDMVSNERFSPFKPLNNDLGTLVVPFSISKNNAALYNAEIDDKGKLKPVGEPIGYTAALSTISNLRGFDASDVEVLIYDEFIPERHEKPIRGEAEAYLNAYETMNRNRELKGEKPIMFLALSNSNDIGNPIFMTLNMVGVCEKMKRKGQEVYIDKRRGYCIIDLDSSPISLKKSETALYRLAGKNSGFAQMALKNQYKNMEDISIQGQNIIEYKPIVKVGEIVIYKHKSKKLFYVTDHESGTVPEFQADDIDLKRFNREFFYLWEQYMYNNILFKNKMCQLLFEAYFK